MDVTPFDMRWEIVGSGWAKLTWKAWRNMPFPSRELAMLQGERP